MDQQFRLIGQGHRAIDLARRPGVRLYSKGEFQRVAETVSAAFWTDTFIPLLRRAASERIASRLTAAAKRAHANAGTYGVAAIGAAELATEVIFDSHLVKPRQEFQSRIDIYRDFAALRKSRANLCLALPLFSRKPVSPVKNRGHYPDLAEIASLLRCYQLAALLSWAYDEEVRFLVFADGVKYRRACGTPLSQIRTYQQALRFWCTELRIGDLVEIVDYEDAVHAALGTEETERREARYRAYRDELHARYGRHFDPRTPAESLAVIERISAEGEQLGYIFRSLAASVHYRTGNLAERVTQHEDAAAERYITYLAHLLDPAGDTAEEDLALRAEAWGAATRYVAISMVDRELEIWSLINPAGVKLTTHAKPGEVELLPTRNPNLTAQHCVGGIARSLTGSKVTNRYRLEHESRGDSLTPTPRTNASSSGCGPSW